MDAKERKRRQTARTEVHSQTALLDLCRWQLVFETKTTDNEAEDVDGLAQPGQGEGDGDLEQHGGVRQGLPVPCRLQDEPTKEQEVPSLVRCLHIDSAFVTSTHALSLLFIFCINV